MLIAGHKNAVARSRTACRITAINTFEPGRAAANKNIGISQRYRTVCRSCTIIMLIAKQTGIAIRYIIAADSTAAGIACYFSDLRRSRNRHPSLIYKRRCQ